MKKRLITSALPYVNNIPHLGNLTQVLSADVFARFCRSRGYETLYVCGTDEYGTASETRALKEGVTPRELCNRYHKIHKEIYEWFNISFDYFGRTSTEKQTRIVQHIFNQVNRNGYITEKTTTQLFCPSCNRFLADRFVEGICPHCHSTGARGDQCDSCQTLLDPTELIEPHCSVCGTAPVVKETNHLYLDLPKALPLLKEWMEEASEKGFWAKNALQLTNSWIRDGLKERCITRDLKWGIPVPLKGYEDKVFYVWFDAPIGYISITANLTDNWEYWWRDPDNTELYQFIGKDNIPFHTVIFPSSLLATGEKWTLLHHMSSTEYLNYEGGKFSKSLGIGVFGNDVQETGIPSDVWRFYMYYNRPEKSDVNFSWQEFSQLVNGELIGNLSNLINRTLTFVSRFYDGKLADVELDNELVSEILKKEEEITAYLERAEERDALRTIFALSDIGNKAFQAGEPWKMRNENPEKAMSLLKTLSYLIKDLAIVLEPFMPETSQKIFSFLNLEPLKWDNLGRFSGIEKISNVSLLFQKLEDEKIRELKAKHSGTQDDRNNNIVVNKENKMSEEVKIESVLEQFNRKVILKVAKIVEVDKHPNGDMLYILKLDTKEEEERTIVSSIVPYYKREELLGRNIVLVSNLKPANFRGVKSFGMLLAASDPDAPEHSTCEVLFADQFEVGTVLEAEGEEPVEKVSTYIKADHFFDIPIYTKDGFVEVEGKKICFDGKYLKAEKYINGEVG